MTIEPKVMIGDRFSEMFERFTVNTPEIALVLARIGLHDDEINNFYINFEDRFIIPTFGLTEPGMGWSRPKHENGIHVTGLDDYGVLMHPSPEVYGHTILHEIGHIDHARRKPNARPRKFWDEKIADRFARMNASIIDVLVDYDLDADVVERSKRRTITYNDKASHYAKVQNQVDKILTKSSK